MSAIISDCGLYRYRLERTVTPLSTLHRTLAVIMVNPSTADATTNDVTIRKVIGFAERNDFGRIIVGNLFAFRATDVRELKGAADPVGPDNDRHICQIVNDADVVLFAWGPLAKQPKLLRERWRAVERHARVAGKGPMCLGVALDGHPRHPLMLPYNQPLTPWIRPE